MQRRTRRYRLLVLLVLTPPLLGMGTGGGTDVIQPAIDVQASLVDRDGTRVELTRFNTGGRVRVEGQMGRGTLRIDFADIRKIEFGAEDGSRVTATVHLRDGGQAVLAVRSSLPFHGRTAVGLYEVRARDLATIEFGE